MLEFYGIIFFLGIVFTVIGIVKMRQYNQLLTTGIRTEGKIVEIKKKLAADGDSRYSYPVFEFETKKYGLMRVESEIGTSGNPYEINQTVKVIYEEEFPRNAEIYGNFRLVVFPRLFIAIGLTILTTGFLILFEVINLEY